MGYMKKIEVYRGYKQKENTKQNNKTNSIILSLERKWNELLSYQLWLKYLQGRTGVALEAGLFQASAAMPIVPVPNLMSRLRQLLLQVQEHLLTPQQLIDPRIKVLLEFW